MNNAWKQWEGQVVEEKFKLRQYIGGSQRSAVFLTDFAGKEPREAAIKLVLMDPGGAELQLYRWKQAAKLTHPHLLQLLGIGRCHLDNMTVLYVVMEYAEEDLSQILPQRPLTAYETRSMLEPALGALAYIHGQGLVHGGLKPANIMAVNDQVKLASDTLCEINEVLAGTKETTVYDPPEMAGGRASPAADIWSLGVTLSEVLTQQTPSWNERREPILPEALTEEFVPIVRQCLQSDPLKRPTVADIAVQLHIKSVRLVDREKRTEIGQQTRAPSIAEKKLAAKTRVIFPVAAAITLLMMLGVWGALRRRSTAERPLRVSEQPAQQQAVGQKLADQQPGGLATRPAASGSAIGTATARPSEQSPPKPQSAGLDRNTGLANQGGEQNLSGTTAARATASSGSSPGDAARSAHGAVIQRPSPEVSPSARDSIHGTLRVSVKVHVDATGRVTAAELSSAGPSKYFSGVALKAARQWTFQPAKIGGENVPSEWLLRFEFRNSDNTVVPVETSP